MKIFAIVFLGLLQVTHAQPDDHLLRQLDLRSEWMVFRDSTWTKAGEAPVEKVIYFSLPEQAGESGHILIESPLPFSLYLNNKLLRHQINRIRISTDSLATRTAHPWLFGVYQAKGINRLTTVYLVEPQIGFEETMMLRKPPFFLSFSILASLLLLTFFVILIRTNPKLTLDYFNFAKLFSLLEREDNMMNSRVSSSVNVLLYFFNGLLSAFLLLVILHNGRGVIAISKYFDPTHLADCFVRWAALTGTILIFTLGKLALLSVLSYLFGMRDQLAFHFYNYMRLSFLIASMAGALCLIFFASRVQNPWAYGYLLDGIAYLLIFWIFLIGIKLLRKSAFRIFHLFSYLCASELIPVVIVIKFLIP